MEPFKPTFMKVYLNTIEITSYIFSYVWEAPVTGIRTATIVTNRNIEDTITITNGQIIEIYESSDGINYERKFYGILLTKTDDVSGFALSCSDELWKATGQTITKLYDIEDPYDIFGGDIRMIMIDLASKVPLTMEDETIDQTSITVPQVLCDGVKIYEKLEQLQLNVLNWDMYQDPVDRKIYVKNPSEYPVYETTLEVGVNVIESPRYGDNITQTINEIELQGVQAFPLYTEQFTGDGTTKTFTLTKKPIATYVKVTVDGVVQKGAVEGSTGIYDYLVNLNQSIITLTISPGAGKIVLIEYTVSELINILVDNPESKIMTQGARKLIYSIPDVASVEDATQRAQAILEESKNSFPNFTISAYNIDGIGGLTPHYKVNYIDALKGKNYNELSIVKIKSTWPEPYTEITLGKSQYNYNNLILRVEERVKKLERTRREGVLLRVNKLMTAPFYFVFDDLQIEQKLVGSGANDHFILGDATYGKLGSSSLGPPPTGNWETIIKRKYTYQNSTELGTGTYDANIKVSGGKIEFI